MERHSVSIGILTILISMSLLAGSALAQMGIHERIHHQQQRISHGIASGALTHHEARILEDNLNHVRATYDRFVADGRLSRHEEQRLNRMLDENDEMISRLRHNSEVRRLY